MNYAVVYAPQGKGKTTNAAELKRLFGLTRVVEEWHPGHPIPDDSLLLSNVDPAVEIHRLREFVELVLRGCERGSIKSNPLLTIDDGIQSLAEAARVALGRPTEAKR